MTISVLSSFAGIRWHWFRLIGFVPVPKAMFFSNGRLTVFSNEILSFLSIAKALVRWCVGEVFVTEPKPGETALCIMRFGQNVPVVYGSFGTGMGIH